MGRLSVMLTPEVSEPVGQQAIVTIHVHQITEELKFIPFFPCDSMSPSMRQSVGFARRAYEKLVDTLRFRHAFMAIAPPKGAKGPRVARNPSVDDARLSTMQYSIDILVICSWTATVPGETDRDQPRGRQRSVGQMPRQQSSRTSQRHFLGSMENRSLSRTEAVRTRAREPSRRSRLSLGRVRPGRTLQSSPRVGRSMTGSPSGFHATSRGAHFCTLHPSRVPPPRRAPASEG